MSSLVSAEMFKWQGKVTTNFSINEVVLVLSSLSNGVVPTSIS